MKEQTAAEKKHIAVLDKKIEKLQNEVEKKHREYDAAAEKLMEVLYERYPECKTGRIKDELYDAYVESGRDLDVKVF
jgi:restriction endonuclease S subunit